MYDRAIQEYEAAYALTMRAPLLYNLGSAYRRKAEETGKLEDKRNALDFYQKYAAAEPNGKGSAEARRWIEVLSKEVAALEAEEAARPKAPEPLVAAPPVAPEPVAPAATVADRPRRDHKVVRLAGLATAAAGVVLIGTGVLFGLKARSAADDLDALEAGGTWDQGLYDSGRAANRNMWIFGGVGVAAAAGGLLTAFVFGRPDEAPKVVLAPTASGGLVVSGRF